MSARRLAVLAGLAGAAALLRRSRAPSADTGVAGDSRAVREADPENVVGSQPEHHDSDRAAERTAIDDPSVASTDAEPIVEPDVGLPSGWEAVEVDAQRPAPDSARPGCLRGLGEIRDFFRANDVPVWFVSPTPMTLLGLDRWVRRFTYVNHYDSFEGAHPNVFVPRRLDPQSFDPTPSITNLLLSNDEVVERIERTGPGKAVFLRFDDETERRAEAAGLEIAFPSASLRATCDSKIEATRLARDLGVPTVPHVLGSARSYEGLVSLADGAGLGRELVVQVAHGDPSHTTFSIASRDDWNTHGAELVGEHLKVMRRITCREASVEAVITAHGTLIGPLLTEVIVCTSPPSSVGGWCETEVTSAALTEEQRRQARGYTRQIGDHLCEEGYRGTVTIEFLVEANGGELYLGGLDPYLTGTSSLNNVAAVGHGDMPLFLFHLLEFMGVEYEIDVDELNRTWAAPRPSDEWSQFVLKDTIDKMEVITEAPRSGVWRFDPDAHGGIRFVRPETDWHSVAGDNEAFYLRVAGEGDYRYPGADLGVLVTRGRLQTDLRELTDRARDWLTGVERQIWTAPPQSPPSALPVTESSPTTMI